MYIAYYFCFMPPSFRRCFSIAFLTEVYYGKDVKCNESYWMVPGTFNE